MPLQILRYVGLVSENLLFHFFHCYSDSIFGFRLLTDVFTSLFSILCFMFLFHFKIAFLSHILDAVFFNFTFVVLGFCTGCLSNLYLLIQYIPFLIFFEFDILASHSSFCYPCVTIQNWETFFTQVDDSKTTDHQIREGKRRANSMLLHELILCFSLIVNMYKV